MDKIFPSQLMQMARDMKVKKSFYLEYDKQSEGCSNCGGIGFMSYFLATLGPLDSPAEGKFVSKWCENKWWCAPSGDLHYGTVSDICPVCKGSRNYEKPVYVLMPEGMRHIFKKLSESKRLK